MKFAAIFSLLLIGFMSVNAQTGEEILKVLRERVDVGKTNQSIAVAVVDEKGARFVNYGKSSQAADAANVDENTIFEIGSITKVFTGILLAEAVKRGEVKLSDTISKYLPASVKTPKRGDTEITLLDLATHTSGLPRLPANLAVKNPQNPYADYTVEDMYQFLSAYELKSDLPAKYDYSNLGAGLLGHILSLAAKTTYEDLVTTRIFKPLKMNDSTITLSAAQKARTAQGFDDSGEPAALWDLPTLAGAGALRSTTKDMAKFLAANLGLSQTNLSAALAESHKPLRDAGAPMKIALGWHIRKKASANLVWHNGGTGGFRSFAGFDATGRKGVVVLTNTAEGVDDIGFHLLDAEMPLKKITPPVAVSEKVLEEYTGEYQLAPNVIFTITRKNDKLFAGLTGQPTFRVFPESENKFFYKVVKAALVFNRGADGKIESLTLIQNGENLAKKIK